MSESWDFDSDRTLTLEGFPWPPPEEGPILAAFGATWKGATFDPGSFFRNTPRDEGTGPALLYYLVIGVLVAVVRLFWALAMDAFGPQPTETFIGGAGIGEIAPLVGFFLTPVILLLALGLGSAIMHLLLLLFGGARHGFGTTVRTYCYASSPTLFGVVPIVGPLVGAVWAVVLQIIGLREAHETETWKAVVAVLLPFAIALALFTLVAVWGLMLLSGAAAL